MAVIKRVIRTDEPDKPKPKPKPLTKPLTKRQRVEDYLARLTAEELARLTVPDMLWGLECAHVYVTKDFAYSILREWRPDPPSRTGRKPAYGWTVYRYYDAEDRLLYVGATGQGHWRAKAHNKTAKWWRLAVRSELEHFDSEAVAFAAEREQIATLKPLYNVADNPNRTTL